MNSTERRSRTLALVDMIERFVTGADPSDRSLEVAGAIEREVLMLFDDAAPFDELVLALAKYRPGGGNELVDHESIKPTMLFFAGMLRERLASA
jgi:hypothetical protein